MSKTLAFTLEGTAHSDQTMTYLHLPFDVPDGVARIDFAYEYSAAIGSDPHLTGGNTVDLGIFDSRGYNFMSGGFRGWSGSARTSAYIAHDDATPGYLPGPIQPGTWSICLGLYKVAEQGCDYKVDITLTFADEARVVKFPEFLPLNETPRSDARSHDGWYKGELHCHTFNSDGDSSSEEVIRAAEALGLDFLAITDHNVLTQQIAMRQAKTQLMLIPGMEVTTYKGHWNIWGDHGWIDFRILTEERMQEAVNTALERGYLVSCNHPRPYGPEWVYPEIAGFHSIEVWNGPWELMNSISLAYWEEKLRAGERYVAVGGSDSHFLKRDHIARLANPTTWIFCPGDPSPAALLQALRAGHAFISESPDGPQLYLSIGDAMMGDTISRSGNEPLILNCSTIGAKGAALEIHGSPGLLHTVNIDQHEWQSSMTIHAQTHYVRAQLVAPSGSICALTNPIYLT